MMAAVATADMVVTNPTHFAVAIAYDRKKDRAPHVVAKGADAWPLGSGAERPSTGADCGEPAAGPDSHA